MNDLILKLDSQSHFEFAEETVEGSFASLAILGVIYCLAILA